MRVFLAGDSLVQDYTDEEFIAGWGQFLKQAVSKDCEVINMAKGGRSSRLFINEGRFDEIDKNIQKGDYLFIEFCHNDDNSKGYKTMFNRLVSTGICLNNIQMISIIHIQRMEAREHTSGF